MFTDWLERRRLVRKGLACDKTRLFSPEETLQGRLETNRLTRLLILAVFIVLLHLGVAWGSLGDTEQDQLLAFIVFVSGLMLLELDSPEVWRSNSKLILVLGAIWFNLVMVKDIYLVLSRHNHNSLDLFYFLSPCTFAPFLITLLLGTRAGCFRSSKWACFPPFSYTAISGSCSLACWRVSPRFIAPGTCASGPTC